MNIVTSLLFGLFYYKLLFRCSIYIMLLFAALHTMLTPTLAQSDLAKCEAANQSLTKLAEESEKELAALKNKACPLGNVACPACPPPKDCNCPFGEGALGDSLSALDAELRKLGL